MKQIVLKKAVFLGLLLLFAAKVFSQQSTADLSKQISPLTPNAASLGKFGDVPVSLYTGIPNIQIPLYEIAIKDFKLPISLSYHAGGVKVNDIASWVGIGWALNAGGLISRQQRGTYDECMIQNRSVFNSYIQTILSTSTDENSKRAAAQNLTLLSNPPYDTEPDIFSINAGNLSQKFFLDDNDNSYCVPARKLDIKHEDYTLYRGPGNRYLFDRWRVTDEKGVQYIFGKTTDGSKIEAEIYCMRNSCGISTDIVEMISSWYLNEIKLPSGESIKFNYEYYSYCIDNDISETLNASYLLQTASKSAVNYTKALRLKGITFPNGKIDFVPMQNTTRCDMFEDEVLEYVNVYKVQGGTSELVKSFKLTTNNPTGINTSNDLSFRLALKSIEEINLTGTKNSIHSFEYNNGGSLSLGLPSRNSKAQDLWGYANGAVSNTTLIPSYIFRYPDGRFYAYLEQANRSINTEQAKAGILQKITYPTGGYSSFDYESNVARGVVIGSGLSANPLYNLANMMSTNMGDKSTGISLENTSGSSEAYSAPFGIFNPNISVSVNVTGMMTWANPSSPCTLNTPPGNVGSFYDCVTISIERQDEITGNYATYFNNVYFNRGWPLPRGTYRAKLKWNDASQIGSWFRVSMNWQDYNEPPAPTINDNSEQVVGGLRIARISDYDPVSQKTKVRKFNYVFNTDDVENSGTSGYIQDAPVYVYSNKPGLFYNGNSNSWYSNQGCVYLTSYVNSPILQTNGGLVGYRKVTVLYGENGDIGRTCSYFLSPKQYPDDNIVNSQLWPFPSSTSFDWRRGLVEKEIDYKNENGSFIPIKTSANNYQFYSSLADQNFKQFPGVKIFSYVGALINNTASNTGGYSIYNTQTESFYLKESTTTEKNSNGDVIALKTYEQSPNSLDISSSTLKNSDNKQITTYSIRAADIYNSAITGVDAASLGIKNLITNKMISAPVENYTVKTMADGSKYVIGGTLTTYYQDRPLPDKIYSLELVTPVLLSTFTPCYINTGGAFVKDSRYKLQVSFDNYDALQNLSEQHKEGAIHSTYIWGYNSQYPVAKIVGSDYTTVNNTINIISNQSLLDNPTDDNALRSYLNALRTGLSNAQITTYTYKPLVGMTSLTDPKGMTTYYEYDGFLRLKTIKDQNGNVIKQYDYHYKQ
jgi:YD repeat-containing protein